MSKLRVAFKQIENVVLMKVLEQPDDINCGGGDFFTASNGFTLSSLSYSGIHETTLFIRGADMGYVDRLGCGSYRTYVHASEAIAMATIAVREYNESLAKSVAKTLDGWEVVE